MKKHLKKSFLGNLLSSDPWMGRIIIGILIVYCFIHIFRLEVYPLYMFAMFSKQEEPREAYYTYKIKNDNDQISFTSWDFRKYTYLLNTIQQYDGIVENEMVHPEAAVIDKFTNRLKLENTTLNASLKSSFTHNKEELDLKMEIWLRYFLDIPNGEIRIEKEKYQWENKIPKFIDKTILYEMD